MCAKCLWVRRFLPRFLVVKMWWSHCASLNNKCWEDHPREYWKDRETGQLLTCEVFSSWKSFEEMPITC